MAALELLESRYEIIPPGIPCTEQQSHPHMLSAHSTAYTPHSTAYTPQPLQQPHHVHESQYHTHDNYNHNKTRLATPSTENAILPINSYHHTHANSMPTAPVSKCRQLPCRTFISTGSCPYSDRCVFLHDPSCVSKSCYIKMKVRIYSIPLYPLYPLT